MITMRDVAAAAGVSPATVSRALNGCAKVNPELRKLIQERARAMNYHFVARGTAQTIAVILPALETGTLGPYTLHILNALRNEFARVGRPVLFISSDDIGQLSEYQVGGAISIAYRSAVGDRLPQLKGIPLVCLNTPGNLLEQVYTVKYNEDQGMKLALDYLYRHGHRRLGFLKAAEVGCGDAENERLAAFQKYAPRFDAVFIESYPRHQFHDAIGMLLKKKVTGIVAADGEKVSPAIYRSLDLYSRRIPEDISVICWEVPGFSDALTPPQTTLAQDFPQIANHAVLLLEKLMRGEAIVDNILLNYQLIERESVASIE